MKFGYALFLSFFPFFLSAQNFTLTYQLPDQLFVCESDTLRIGVKNNTAAPVLGAQLTAELPGGLSYVGGSVSGAFEFNILDLQKPVLELPLLVPGASANLKILISAGCDLIAAINAGQLFSAVLRVQAGSTAEQVTTANFPVETGLLVITQVDNDSLAGEIGQVFTRTLHVKNSRLGLIRHLTLHDVFPDGGFSIHTPGAAMEQSTAIDFTARFDGSFFAGFGDGDALLEFGEEILIQEIITITDCGDPEFLSRSNISTAWGCQPDMPTCQADSVRAKVFIQPFSQEGFLSFYPQYGLPWDMCAGLPSDVIVKVVNEGTLPVSSTFADFTSQFPDILAMDPGSFVIFKNGVAMPLVPNLADPVIQECGLTLARDVVITLPPVDPGDTLELRFQTFFCSDTFCQNLLPDIGCSYFYSTMCGGNSGMLAIVARQTQGLIGLNAFQIGDCLLDGQVYDFRYDLLSERLYQDTGYLWIRLDLPWGLFWSPDCPPQIGGAAPERFSIDTFFNSGGHKLTEVLMAFGLPLQDSAKAFYYCLLNTCCDSMAYKVPVGATGPDAEGEFIAYAPPNGACDFLGYHVETAVMLTPTLDPDFGCAVASCDQYDLQLQCACPDDGGGPGGGGPGDCAVALRDHYAAARLNYDLPDNDDDRHADPSGSLDLNKVRRDRFIPGDTLQALISTKVLCGMDIEELNYQLFTEVLRSDIPYAGVLDTFDLSAKLARQLFAGKDTFSVVEVLITVFDSSANTQYSCNWDLGLMPLANEQLFGRIAETNVKPLVIKDELVTMNYRINPQMTELPCLPAGFGLDAGDSVEMRVRYKLEFNYTPFYPNQRRPPLINFEMGFNLNGPQSNFYSYRAYDTLMFQYSGFLDTLGKNTFGIKPCENSTEVKPFVYYNRLARENLFPYEVRPLGRITDYALVFPKGLTPVSATLAYLRLQENVPLFQNQPIPYTVQDSAWRLDFSSFFTDPLDEGYRLETRLVFGPDCKFTLPDSARQILTVAYPGCLHMPNPETIVSTNSLGFFSLLARDTLLTNEVVWDHPTGVGVADVLLKNLAPAVAPHYWVELISLDGGLTDFELFALPQGTLYPDSNGIFQLGTLGILDQQNLRIRARNTSCQPQRLLIRYGWDCAPHVESNASTCAGDTLTLLFQPQNPEMEIDLTEMPAEVPLCDTSGWFVLDISDADLGFAYNPLLYLKLPPGIQLVSGSSQLAYPTGAAWQPIPDPLDLGNNAFQWDLGALQPLIGANGLPGVNLAPQNAAQIRFRLLSFCGVVSNAQIIYGVTAEQACGLPTNTVSKASDPISIEGLTPAYGVQVSVTEPSGGGPVGCGQERVFQVSLQLGGSPEAGDSIYIDLPAGFTYAAGSYQPGANAPAGPPQLTNTGLQLPLPVGLSAGATLVFSVKIISAVQPNCSGVAVLVQTRQRATAFCPLINADCAVYIATGTAIYPLLPADPEVVVTAAGVSINANGSGTYSATLTNQGNDDASPQLIRFYRDVDGDGQLSPADTLVFSVGLTATIGAGGNFFFSENGGPQPFETCNLLAVLPAAENCDCEASVFPVQSGQVSHTVQELCLGQLGLLGIDSVVGHSYQWTGLPAGLCATCPSVLFQPSLAGQYAFTLTDATASCSTPHLFSVEVFPLPGGLSADTSICKGEPVTLQAGAADSWHWEGPGILNPGASFQILMPLQTADYAVTLTNGTGCTGVESATIKVLPTDTIDLGIIKTCEGTPVEIFGAMQDSAAVYTQILPNQYGCDSLITLRLEIVPHTTETLPRCPGDTVLVFGAPVSAAGTYCREFPSSLGCDSMHCVVVTDFPGIQVTPFDTLYLVQGDTVPLPGPPGFTAYSWSPAEGLSCTECPSPLAFPTDTMTYTLTVTNGDGCSALLQLLILLAPPCDPAHVKIPNAITPDGDGVNDVLRVVPFEGQETISRLQVYDRWGKKVYEGSGPAAAWDGSIDGKPAPSDVYVWILEVECSGEKEQRVGDVTVLR